jgi:hypothetical protein
MLFKTKTSKLSFVLLSIALYYFISTLYMYSNWNYQNLPGKSCRIEKNPIMISPYSIFEVNISEKIFWLLSIFCQFFKLSIWISCFRVLFGCNSTFEHPAYLNSAIFTHIYASVVYLIAKYYEMFAFSPPFFVP